MKIEKVELYEVNVPLKQTFKISFFSFETVSLLFAVIHGKNRIGCGEAVTVKFPNEPDYNEWEFCNSIASNIIGMEIQEAKELILTSPGYSPRSSQALLSSLEQLDDPTILAVPKGGYEVPIVGVLLEFKEDKVKKQLNDLLKKGYKIIKVKVGFNLKDDLDRMNIIQKTVGDRGKIRIDANQAYSFDEAKTFVQSVEPSNIQLFEQPFETTCWGDMTKLKQISPIPLMLDESINTEEDIDKAFQGQCADYIKLKLVRTTSVNRLKELAKYAKDRGFKVIIGNGASGDIGCFQEAVVIAEITDQAGENNGFCKNQVSFLEEQLTFENGSIFLNSGYLPRLNMEEIQRFKVREKVYS